MIGYVIVLVTLSTRHPCPLASVPVDGCLDYVTRMSGPLSLAQCEFDVVWWRKHIRDGEDDVDDTGEAVCVRVNR